MSAFHGKVAIVTGGASGIGRALVHGLVGLGAKVTILDKDAEGSHRVVAELNRRGVQVRAIEVDVRDREAVEKAVQPVAAEGGHLDLMFNNAGITQFAAVEDYDWAAWKDVIDTDLYGVVHGVAACYPIMVKQRAGHIVNTASLAAVMPTPWAVSYTAAKAGVWGLSVALRVEAEPLGIKVSCVCPAAVNTPIIDNARYINLDKARAIASIPGSRITPDACAAAILRGVERNDSVIVPSAARWLSMAQRLAPAAVEKLMGRVSRTLDANRADTVAARRAARKAV